MTGNSHQKFKGKHHLPLMKWSKASHRDVPMRASLHYKIYLWWNLNILSHQRVTEHQSLKCSIRKGKSMIWQSHCCKPNVSSKSHLSQAAHHFFFFFFLSYNFRMKKTRVHCLSCTNKIPILLNSNVQAICLKYFCPFHNKSMPVSN